MRLSLFTDDLCEAEVDLLGVGVFSDEPDRGLAFSQLNRALGGALDQACRDEDFRGRPGQGLVYNVGAGMKARRVFVHGLGERDRYNAEAARRFAGAAAKVAKAVNATSAALVLTVGDAPGPVERVVGLVQALAEGTILGSYRFTTYVTRDQKSAKLDEVRIAFAAEDVPGVRGATLREALARGQTIAGAVAIARDLVNEPANAMTPTALGEHSKRMAKAAGLGFKLLGPKEIERQGMGLLIGVARGSEEEPRVIHLTYTPAEPKDAPVIALVGKGLTFDSGGLSLKTSEGMVDMKADMGGGAAVIGAMLALAELKPRAVVHGIVAAAENMPDGRAIRPGDVLRSKKGLTVEVLNTDAEGRLVLGDAITYALELKPTDLIDVATLTGACVVALGRTIAGAFVDDEAMARDLETAWKRSGEAFWRMPLEPEMRELLKSEVADIKNIADRYGGAITGALFLKDFAQTEGVRWAHLDIAGPVLSVQERGYVQKGASGFGVRTLIEYVLRRAEAGLEGPD